MILLGTIIIILALSDPDWSWVKVPLFLQSADHIAGNDGFPVRLATVDNKAFRSTILLNGLGEEPLGCSQVPMLAKPEVKGVSEAVDGPIKLRPLPPDLKYVSSACNLPATERFLRLKLSKIKGEKCTTQRWIVE